MPTVKVSPYREPTDISHDVSLSHDASTLGLMYDRGNPAVLQHIPITEPVRQFSETQKDWTGGRGRKFFREDITAFWDAKDTWTQTGGKLFACPEWKFGSGFVKTDSYWGGSVKWLPLYGSNRYQATRFAASDTYSALYTLVKIRQVGLPGTLRIAIYSDFADPSSPDSSLKTQTLTATAGDFEHKDYEFTLPSALSLTSGTNYWIVINGTANDTDANHWEVGTDASGGRYSLYATSITGSPTDWTNSNNDIYFRIAPAYVSQRVWHFIHDEALYAIVTSETGTSPNLYINGDRGIATAGASSSITNTGNKAATWTSNKWAGAWVRIIAGAGKGQARQIASNTSTVLTVSPDWDINPTTTSRYVIYSTPYFTEITGHGLTKNTCRPVSANRVMYFAQGTGINLRRGREDTTQSNCHAWADTDTLYRYDFIEPHMLPNAGLRLFLGKAGACSVGYVTPPEWGSGVVTVAPIKGGVAGANDAEITSIKSAGDKIYVGKENALFWIDETTPKQFTLQIKDVPDPNNLLGITSQGETVYFGYGGSFGYMTAGQHKDILNYRAGYEGLPADRVGYVSHAITVMGWVFFSVDGGSSNYSTVYAWNGIGLHEIWRGWRAGIKIRDLFWQPCQGTRGRLWLDTGTDSVYIEFPLNRSNPLLDTSISHCSDFSLVTGTMDIEKENLYKAFTEIRIGSENLGVGVRYVDVDYQADADVETTNWTYIGRVDVSPYAVLPFARGSIHKIRFRLRAHTDDGSTPVIITSTDILGEISEPPRYQWIGTFQVAEDQETYDGQADFKPTYVYNWLKEAHDKMIVCEMRATRSIDDKKKVTLSLPSDQVSEIEKGKWNGRISIQIREVKSE